MFEYINGILSELNPAYAVIEAGGVGYKLEITLQTYTSVQRNLNSVVKLYTEPIIKEDSHQLYGFAAKPERELFRALISVSGVGANTARMILSSLSPGEIQNAILNDDVSLLKSVKGIGLKTAQRLVLELKDKLSKLDLQVGDISGVRSPIKDDALFALESLGFVRKAILKTVDKIVLQNPDISVEEVIKRALKEL